MAISIPPEVLGLVTNMAVTLARARRADRQSEERFAGVGVTAAVAAIEECGASHPAASPVWDEVVSTLGSPESALAVIERLAQQQPLLVSAEAEPFLRTFAERFIAEAVDASAGAKAETVAILTAIGLLKAQLTMTAPLIDPLAGIPWHRRPGAPKFRISPGIDGQRFLVHIELVGGTEPGDLTAGWAVNAGAEVHPMLMPQPGSTWSRHAKPATCEWPEGAAELVAHLRLRFVTPEGEHGYHYSFPLEQHRKGHWLLQSHEGTTVHSPEPF